MKTLRMFGMALVAMMLCIGVSSCSKDDDNFIEVDYSNDLVGTWTLLEPELAEALVISADGSVVSTGIEGEVYWENVKGTFVHENNKIEFKFEDGDSFKGRFDLIPGQTLSLVDTKTGERLTYSYCKKDLSKEILGQWVSMNSTTNTSVSNTNDMLIYNYKEDGTVVRTGYSYELKDFFLNKEATYKVIGDLLITKRFEEADGVYPYLTVKLNYSPDATAYGDIMTYTLKLLANNNVFEATSSFLRVKQYLELPGQKYDYIRTYLTNATGLDKDFNAGGFTLNFSKLDGNLLDKMLKTLLFTVEFPDANTIKYSYTYNGETVSASAPIEVDGNKMTVKMDKTRGHFRDIDLYSFQDKDNTQMHFYMSKNAFINYFGNISVSLLEAKGELDPNDKTAVDAVFNELTEIVKTINVSFIMSKSK